LKIAGIGSAIALVVAVTWDSLTFQRRGGVGGHGWKETLAKEKRTIATWPSATRAKWDAVHETDARLSVNNFEDWLKTGQGMSVTEWLRSKGRWPKA
jgi:hypothetical protein